jgi:hypothetical protein
MNKKLFAELMEGVQQMLDHASGKKVKGVREVVKERKALKPLFEEEIVKPRKKPRRSKRTTPSRKISMGRETARH